MNTVDIMEKVYLSEQDKRILRLIQKNASMSRQELAEAANVSPTTLWRRLNELEKLGVIEDRVTILNAEKVGMAVCFLVSINMASHEAAPLEEFEQFVTNTAEVMECYSMTGQHDYLLIVRTETVADFQKLLMNRILTHPSVENAMSTVTLSRLKYTTALPL